MPERVSVGTFGGMLFHYTGQALHLVLDSGPEEPPSPPLRMPQRLSSFRFLGLPRRRYGVAVGFTPSFTHIRTSNAAAASPPGPPDHASSLDRFVFKLAMLIIAGQQVTTFTNNTLQALWVAL